MVRNFAFFSLLMFVFSSCSEDIPSPGEPEESHHIAYTEALENAFSFEIEFNRLYVYYDNEDYRMVFLELKEN
ncbi:hypothetical protein SAMN04488057_10593 [Cyclobacterium lianum]|uniref:Uncharacterized protein n=1 Tax=Cyclobacterium lianum TaxID=388280 RepID=A0A1M7N6P5_9BACT|nr:hypothetical protein [Cyclobacterium lianum]SHM99166.1 hypothetical protein SAMN04488057_10593 [Cyclobacterium lianum]